MDISGTTTPKSDQQNFDDYIAGPRTWTISDVKAGTAEQPVEIHLTEAPGRPYKPSKSMRRVLVSAWGPEASAYIGRRITLYGDPDVKWAGQPVGGIRISHLSDLTKPLKMSLTEKRGSRAPYVVQPLAEAPAPAWRARVTAAPDVATLSEIHAEAVAEGWVSPELLAALTHRKGEL